MKVGDMVFEFTLGRRNSGEIIKEVQQYNVIGANEERFVIDNSWFTSFGENSLTMGKPEVFDWRRENHLGIIKAHLYTANPNIQDGFKQCQDAIREYFFESLEITEAINEVTP
ncbi:hypothetical protein [Parasporobacterium paucivorans]|uniref:Uncharacterized protein n=1 Tax=Parasporobacterium paucivorans DSM 15970 TaxID=1122934 RepID=A0A1M6B7C4_9FIRM|nr:hypothetical protein [Parasporobacterium paucivorans]SHI44383.1 hypothetical protein SAMN02745691_00274 [Parasporobacterium paucivorans DSM 15970]